MALKFTVNTLDEVPENARSLYSQRDGKFVLSVEGDVPGYVPAAQLAEANGKLAEFRENNIKLLKALGVDGVDAGVSRAALFAGFDAAKLEALKAVDPAEYQRLKANADKLTEKGIKDPEDVTNVLTRMLDERVKPLRDALAAEQQARRDSDARAAKALLRETVGGKYLKVGGKPAALDFIIQQAEGAFEVAEGQIKARLGKLSPKDGSSPLTVDEWMESAAKEYDFAFEASQGAGLTQPVRKTPAGGPSTFRTPSGAQLKTDGITVLTS